VDLSGLGWGPVVGSCEHSNDPLCSIKDEQFVDRMSNCQLLEQDPDYVKEVLCDFFCVLLLFQLCVIPGVGLNFEVLYFRYRLQN
jgi:hypothetical protein